LVIFVSTKISLHKKFFCNARNNGLTQHAQRSHPHKTMKTKILFIALGTLLAPALGLAQTPVLVQTQSSSWNVTRSATLTSTATTANQINEETTSLSVNKYSGILDLTRVVIRVLQPNSPTSPTISATISVVGTTTFTADTNSISEVTLIDGGATSITSVIEGMGGTINTYSKTAAGTSFAGQTITSGSPTVSNADITQASYKMFDSSIWGLTSSQLNSVFRGGSAISFNTLNTNDKFTFKRDNTDSLTAVFGGTNSGTISIEYYAVPEPETWALLAFSLTTIMVLRRRRNY